MENNACHRGTIATKHESPTHVNVSFSVHGLSSLDSIALYRWSIRMVVYEASVRANCSVMLLVAISTSVVARV